MVFHVLREVKTWTWSVFLYCSVAFLAGWTSDTATVGLFAVHCAAALWTDVPHRAEALIPAVVVTGLKLVLCLEAVTMLKQLYGPQRPQFFGLDVARSAPLCCIGLAVFLAGSARVRGLRSLFFWLWKLAVVLGEVFHHDMALKVTGVVLCPALWALLAWSVQMVGHARARPVRDYFVAPSARAALVTAAEHGLYILLTLHLVPHALLLYALQHDAAFGTHYYTVQRMLNKKPTRSCLQPPRAGPDAASGSDPDDTPDDAAPLKRKKSVSFTAGTRIIETPKKTPKKLTLKQLVMKSNRRLQRMGPAGGYYVAH